MIDCFAMFSSSSPALLIPQFSLNGPQKNHTLLADGLKKPYKDAGENLWTRCTYSEVLYFNLCLSVLPVSMLSM